MKAIRTGPNEVVFQLRKREKELLLEVMRPYPLVPVSHHLLRKSAAKESADENQRLLDQALAEQRQTNRRQVQALLSEPGRFREAKPGVELTLSLAEVEWLLQVLNDVRVGSWLALGEPEQGKEPEMNEDNAHYLMGFHVSGLFQTVLLAALGVIESSQWSASD